MISGHRHAACVGEDVERPDDDEGEQQRARRDAGEVARRPARDAQDERERGPLARRVDDAVEPGIVLGLSHIEGVHLDLGEVPRHEGDPRGEDREDARS